MTMMLRIMLTVIIGMKMHEYDNDDPECKIDADAGGATDIVITRQSASP